MIKKRYAVLFFFVLFLTACASPASSTLGTETPTYPSVVSSSVTASPTLTIPILSTITLSATPPPTITPLPTIPTFTPTFDARTIVTVTPAAKAECPKENSAITINLTPPWDDLEFEKKQGHFILDALNDGLSIRALKAETEKQKYRDTYLDTYYEDVTGDGVKDFILSDYRSYFDIFYCRDGKYDIFALEDGPEFYPWDSSGVWEIIDRNQNGLPEIVFYQGISLRHGYWLFHIYEWDGKTFVDLTDDPDTDDEMTSYLPKGTTKEDVNHDGLTDLVFTDGGPDDVDLWARQKTTTYSWNGKFYVKSYISYARPHYRYQAIQDGDRETAYGHYDKAITLYQEAIFNDQLDWMSLEKALYQIKIEASKYDKPTPTVYPSPVPDLTEYPRLAAYAYYRMMILHTYLNEMDAAQIQYATLQQKFPVGNPGHPYAEMATQFWNVYQISQAMRNACDAAIIYARDHREILDVLEGAAGGNQTLDYDPPAVCPFR